MKKKVSKAKAPKRSAKKTEPEIVTPDLISIMTKIAERLEALERKTDQIINKMGHAQSTEYSVQKNQERQPQHHRQNSQPPRQGQPQSNQNPPQSHGRQLYQAVCADCNKSCEIPFKPSGDRPVYCKECFADRKANQKGNSHKPAPSLAGQAQRPHFGQARQIRNEKHGVGRITVSEMAPAHKRKNQKLVRSHR